MMLIVGPILVTFAAVLLAVALTIAVMWVGYRLIVSAVRSGILEANAEQARRDQGLPPSNWSILAAKVTEPVTPYTAPSDPTP